MNCKVSGSLHRGAEAQQQARRLVWAGESVKLREGVPCASSSSLWPPGPGT